MFGDEKRDETFRLRLCIRTKGAHKVRFSPKHLSRDENEYFTVAKLINTRDVQADYGRRRFPLRPAKKSVARFVKGSTQSDAFARYARFSLSGSFYGGLIGFFEIRPNKKCEILTRRTVSGPFSLRKLDEWHLRIFALELFFIQIVQQCVLIIHVVVYCSVLSEAPTFIFTLLLENCAFDLCFEIFLIEKIFDECFHWIFFFGNLFSY